MERRFYRELWDVRLKKMLDLEEKSVELYEELAKQARSFGPRHAIVPHLERLIVDEKKHALLVRELLAIADRQAR
jgi:hypothetical protein